MKPVVVVASLVCAGVVTEGAEPVLHTFKKLHLDKYYWSEGANFGDLNKDGFADAISGPYWWEGPDFTKRHEIYAAKTTFALKNEPCAVRPRSMNAGRVLTT